MRKCPVCAVEVEDTAPFCNICGVNLAGAKDVGPSNVETPVAKEENTSKVSSVSSIPPVSSGRAKSSFYLPALQFLFAVALLGLVLYYTTADVHRLDLHTPDTFAASAREVKTGLRQASNLSWRNGGKNTVSRMRNIRWWHQIASTGVCENKQTLVFGTHH